jgi:hypothetical protein
MLKNSLLLEFALASRVVPVARPEVETEVSKIVCS